MSLTHENVISLSQYNYLLNVRNPFLNSLVASDEMSSRRFFLLFVFLLFCLVVSFLENVQGRRSRDNGKLSEKRSVWTIKGAVSRNLAKFSH